MTWRAYIEGDENDLQDLVELFPDGDPSIGHEADSGYYISSASLEDDNGAVNHEMAAKLLTTINGIARVQSTAYRPVHLTGTYRSPDGKQSVVILVDSIEVRARMGTPTILTDGVPQPAPESEGGRYFKVAEADTDAADIFRIMAASKRELDWIDIYKVWEIVEKTVGGKNQVAAKGWLTKSDIERLTASANHPEISGDNARHARMPGTPGQHRVMTLAEANTLIRELVSAWVESRHAY
jgi:hypothetical protein